MTIIGAQTSLKAGRGRCAEAITRGAEHETAINARMIGRRGEPAAINFNRCVRRPCGLRRSRPSARHD
jgi:hypothetical protein